MVDHIRTLLLNPSDTDGYLRVREPQVDAVLSLFGITGASTDAAVVDSLMPLVMAPDLRAFRTFFDQRVTTRRSTDSVYRHDYTAAGSSLNGIYDKLFGAEGWFTVSDVFASDEQVVSENLDRMRAAAMSADSAYAVGAVLLACAYRRLVSKRHYTSDGSRVSSAAPASRYMRLYLENVPAGLTLIPNTCYVNRNPSSVVAFVDWGDGSSEKATGGYSYGSGTWYNSYIGGHTYSAAGNYVITIYGESIMDIGCGSNYPIFTTASGADFPYLKKVEIVNIPAVYGYSFCGCTGLESVSLSGVSTLGTCCFWGCTSLKSIKIPDSVTSIGTYCFSHCSALGSIDLPANITSLGQSFFYGCSSLRRITIPDGVKTLGNYCFSGCSSLKSIDMPSALTTIGQQCFYGCSSLRSIVIPDGVTSLLSGCFNSCENLAQIVLPSGLTSIGTYCFYGCSSLAAITIPDSVTAIGLDCFYKCVSLVDVTLGSGLTSLPNYCFERCTALEAIVIPDGVTSLSQECFFGCSSLRSVTFGSGVASIGKYCFQDCKELTSIDLPASVTTIEYEAFYRCASLTRITSRPTTPPTLGSYAFYGVDAGVDVYVPDASVDAYKAASGWSSFTNYIAIE